MQELTIIQGHVLPALATIPNGTVDLIVTSPPYWGLRDYGEETVTVWDGEAGCEHIWQIVKKEATHGGKGILTEMLCHDTFSSFCSKCGAWRGQLGLEPSLDLYLKHLLQITAELKRVLKPSGVMFWNHGDSYGGSWQNYGAREGTQRPKNTVSFELRGNPSEEIPPTARATEKCLCLQNFRLLIRLVDEQGWIARNNIPWVKPNGMPSSVRDRFTNKWEPIFFLSKSNDTAYYWNEKTGLMADRPPAERLEGRDWEWRKVPGKPEPKKYSFWSSMDYWFDLDAVCEPPSPNSHP